MNESKLSHAVGLAFISAMAKLWAVTQAHAAGLATFIAIVAGCYSIAASYHTIKFRKWQQRDKRNDE
jgi:hypothetical protein